MRGKGQRGSILSALCVSFRTGPDVFLHLKGMQHARRQIIALALALLTAGCYRLTPIEGVVPGAGADVRVDLTDAGSVRLAPQVGARIAAIDGRALQSNDSAIVLAVAAVVAQNGRSMPWSQERLSVPRDAVSSLRTRTLDRKKTWFVAGLSVVGVLLLGDVFGLGTGLGGLIGIGGGGGRQ
jgi:hypothetical protein